jgi:nucleotide-binding universal stress UspA family protein
MRGSVMFEKILVAIDGTESSQTIFEQALELAVANQSALMLLRVLEPFDDSYIGAAHAGLAYSTFKVYMDQLKAREQIGVELLRSLEEQGTARGISTEFTQSVGDPGKLICGLAQSWEADLIMVGRRGLGGVSEFFMGSVSNYVLHHADCDVLILHRLAPVPPHREALAAAMCSI